MLLRTPGLKELPDTASHKELLGAPGIATRSMLLWAAGLKELPGTASNKELLGAPGIATRSKDATTGSWP